jgi:hypothetical protein
MPFQFDPERHDEQVSRGRGFGRTAIRRSFVVATMCAGLMGLSGCSGSTIPILAPSADSSEAATTALAHPVTSSVVSAGPSSSSSPSTVAVVHALHGCVTSDLAVSVVGGDGAGGGAQAILRFRNIGPAPCSLRGYPTVLSLDTAHHRSLPTGHSLRALWGGTATVSTIDIADGQTASATLEWGDNPVGTATTCPAFPTIAVTAPGTRRAVRLRIPLPVQGCSGVSVLPVVAGIGGTVAA